MFIPLWCDEKYIYIYIYFFVVWNRKLSLCDTLLVAINKKNKKYKQHLTAGMRKIWVLKSKRKKRKNESARDINSTYNIYFARMTIECIIILIIDEKTLCDKIISRVNQKKKKTKIAWLHKRKRRTD